MNSLKSRKKLRIDDIHVEIRTKRRPNTSRKKWGWQALGSNAAAREEYPSIMELKTTAMIMEITTGKKFYLLARNAV
jgi:hypothetical protein